MMLQPDRLYELLRDGGIGMFTGVPDSLLSGFCAYLCTRCAPGEHVVAPNEGSAVGIAAGYHLATGGSAAVYLQNSGLGNAINPLVSLTDRSVYSIPLLLLIGWRGQPGGRDEPQHLVQGAITAGQLELLGIPYWTVDGGEEVIARALRELSARNAPVALLIRSGAVALYPLAERTIDQELSREAALGQLLDLIDPRDVVVATTGKTSRELFELRVNRSEPQRDFLTVGSMGHAAAVALGVALAAPNRRVFCLDGDGAMLMHMGMLPTVGASEPSNLVHIILNNAAHESVGGHPTVAGSMDFGALARGSGYAAHYRSATESEIHHAWRAIDGQRGPVLWEIPVALGSRPDLGRPTSTPLENKSAFMHFVQG